jgi:hypothetical protein
VNLSFSPTKKYKIWDLSQNWEKLNSGKIGLHKSLKKVSNGGGR